MGLRWTTQRTIRELVKKCEPFKLDNISAIVVPKGETLTIGELETISDINDIVDKGAESDLYVVYSYHTPIGWCKMDDPISWHIPDLFYTFTTEHHQNVLRAAISTYAAKS